MRITLSRTGLERLIEGLARHAQCAMDTDNSGETAKRLAGPLPSGRQELALDETSPSASPREGASKRSPQRQTEYSGDTVDTVARQV